MDKLKIKKIIDDELNKFNHRCRMMTMPIDELIEYLKKVNEDMTSEDVKRDEKLRRLLKPTLNERIVDVIRRYAGYKYR
jgi:hypothetical protein